MGVGDKSTSKGNLNSLPTMSMLLVISVLSIWGAVLGILRCLGALDDDSVSTSVISSDGLGLVEVPVVAFS